LKLYNAANKKLDEAMAANLAEIARVQTEIKPPQLADKMLAAEIRAAAKQASTIEERAKVLEGDDDRVMSAVANGPAFLSGLDEKQFELYVGLWSDKRFPAESGRVRRLRAALEDARKIGKSANGYFVELTKAMVTPMTQTAMQTEAAQAAVASAVAAE
jgi:hypothetical protein